jgi:hypothetical protein
MISFNGMLLAAYFGQKIRGSTRTTASEGKFYKQIGGNDEN